MRIIIVLLASGLLCGCNVVLSRDPWFSRADELSGAELAQGLWVRFESGGCQFDESRPAEVWPDCAAPFVVRPHEILIYDPDRTSPGRPSGPLDAWSGYEVVLADGDPRILQVARCLDDSDGQKAKGKADPLASLDGHHCYIALRAERTSAQGQIIAFESWVVSCGPLPDEVRAKGRYVTDRPFAGLRVEESNCVALSREALRNAAKASEALTEANGGDDKKHARWVREGYH